MPASFAALETRVNAAVLARLANARVLLGGVDVDVIFENPSATAGGGLGMASTAPTVKLLTASVPANPVGQTFDVAGVTWEIADHDPDGTGWSVLVLERAS